MTKDDPNVPVTNKTFEKAMKRQDQRLNEAVDAIVTEMDRIAKEILEHEDREHEKIRQEIRTQGMHIRDEINGMKADLSGVPTRAEFEEIKARLQKIENVIIRD